MFIDIFTKLSLTVFTPKNTFEYIILNTSLFYPILLIINYKFFAIYLLFKLNAKINQNLFIKLKHVIMWLINLKLDKN